MLSNIEYFLFVMYPYVAITVCVWGCIIRYDREPYTWKAGSSQMLSKKGTRLSNNLFHIGILGIVGGHLVGLLMPHWFYEHFMSSGFKQWIAVIAGGAAGVCIFIGLILMIHRRYTNPRIKTTSSFGDKAILWLLLWQIILGLASIYASSHHMDGSVMVKLGYYFQSGLILDLPNGYEGIKEVNMIYKLHIISGFTIIFFVPFSRLHHAISAPVWYIFRNYQVVRARRHRQKEFNVE